MFTPRNVGVVLILVFIVSLASWSKLRFVDEDDHAEQRWRVEDYPGFSKKGHATSAPQIDGQSGR
ncbi:MAG: hypothetical protein B6D72_13190 [gamma proteobacterium symbiont of Ctena orbiculata]|nr:hypothetical protein [Candidatus Thiodiazotropha taylori]PUB82169.1 MAG: hypothetical protein DBP00_18085 [gamma proteobacterium symbiont of Ctena orbiculata]MBV2113071.1 hypothetical protein [Candidatus Thiodiazotropha taylori]PVV10131.1 MAG: hypothetical protein B6D72_13190 [gamma proteobacterium symbiont of Ctena orbiculata]PVV15372.1 MAG: hypothetical protein B6D82_03850 [gamma proteobacterium symbiont of Ctena orbiculata]